MGGRNSKPTQYFTYLIRLIGVRTCPSTREIKRLGQTEILAFLFGIPSVLLNRTTPFDSKSVSQNKETYYSFIYFQEN